MGKKAKVLYRGRVHKGRNLNFTIENDVWTVVKVEDGAEIKIKPGIARIVRSDEFDPDGNPIYIMNTSILLTQNVPDELKNYKSDTLRPKPSA